MLIPIDPSNPKCEKCSVIMKDFDLLLLFGERELRSAKSKAPAKADSNSQPATLTLQQAGPVPPSPPSAANSVWNKAYCHDCKEMTNHVYVYHCKHTQMCENCMKK